MEMVHQPCGTPVTTIAQDTRTITVPSVVHFGILKFIIDHLFCSLLSHFSLLIFHDLIGSLRYMMVGGPSPFQGGHQVPGNSDRKSPEGRDFELFN